MMRREKRGEDERLTPLGTEASGEVVMKRYRGKKTGR
jgi:hypothetical protein